MNIEVLPIEMLMEIFSYLPNCRNVCLVSRKFYAAGCKLKDKNITLNADTSFLDRRTLTSILESNRKITKAKIKSSFHDETELEMVLSIIRKFSTSLTDLSLQQTVTDKRISKAYFLQILSLVPRLVNLNCEEMKLAGDTMYEEPKKIGEEQLNVIHLKTLHLNRCNIELAVLFNRLPPGVLTALHLVYAHLGSLFKLLREQPNIKTLVVEECSGYGSINYDMLSLESLTIHEFQYEHSHDSLLAQTKLKCLQLRMRIPEKYGNDFLRKISNFHDLKHLTINFYGAYDIFDEFTKTNNSRLESLQICGCSELNNDQIHALSVSAPKLKVFKAVTELSWDQIVMVLKHFCFVESLEVRLGLSVDTNKYSYGTITHNANLTRLQIVCFWGDAVPFLEEMISKFPNLKELNHFRPIIKVLLMPKFRDDSVTTEITETFSTHALNLTKDDIKLLRSHKDKHLPRNMRGIMTYLKSLRGFVTPPTGAVRTAESRTYLWLSGFHHQTTTAQIIDLVAATLAVKGHDIICRSLKSSRRTYTDFDKVSFRVGLKSSDLKDSLTKDIWPKGVICKLLKSKNYNNRQPV
ncbi:hypothetical protein Bhyg_08631 [Pseudolycoriella hygida]|uniref:F-box domain-containing protein n=1 Tax=Pseudolycoriella hygida TaxID=35572 RepID=A0A9Q0N5Q7_9DIPT|nr:hypothetical protein Bhyg_08631 [Pseudolycoriella hygida]